MFEFVWCLKNDVQVCSMFNNTYSALYNLFISLPKVWLLTLERMKCANYCRFSACFFAEYNFCIIFRKTQAKNESCRPMLFKGWKYHWFAFHNFCCLLQKSVFCTKLRGEKYKKNSQQCTLFSECCPDAKCQFVKKNYTIQNFFWWLHFDVFI